MKKIIFTLFLISAFLTGTAQENIHYVYQKDYTRVISPSEQTCANPRYVPVPDIQGYKTLKTDLHCHTYYSDAHVSPQMRVAEAWLEGLDVLAITDHRPCTWGYIKVDDKNRSILEAESAAKEVGMKIIRGFEFTAGEPMGHINVLFVKDVNAYRFHNEAQAALTTQKCDSILSQATAEGAFITTNHPGWPDQNSTLSEYIKSKVQDGTIRGIEIFNDKEFYPMAIDHANDYNLSMLSCTDTHVPTFMSFDQKDNHRDITLVFARDTTDESIKEALNAGRTIAWANNTLAGREPLLREFLHACVKVEKTMFDGTFYRVRLKNVSAIPFTAVTENPQETITIPALGYAEIKRRASGFSKSYTISNVFISSGKHLEIPLSFLTQGESPVSLPTVRESSISFSDSGLEFSLTAQDGETFYTIDGSEPDATSIRYNGLSILLKSPATIKAVTIKNGIKSSVMTQRMGFSMAIDKKVKRHGVSYKMYEHPDILSTKDLEKIGVITKEGTYPVLQITDGIDKDHFGYIFSGYISIPETGSYSFCLKTNDGSDLFIGGELACDNDQHNGYKVSTGSIYLQKGIHPYTLRYFEGYGMEEFSIQWMTPKDDFLVDIPMDKILFTE